MTETIQTKTSAASIYSRGLIKQNILFPSDDSALLKEEQAAAFLGVTRRALQSWRLSGQGPQYIRISSRCIRYRKRELVTWSENRLQTSTSEEVQA